MRTRCLECGGPIDASPRRRSEGRGRYCSRSCLARSRRGPACPRYVHGRYARRELRCPRCGGAFVGKGTRRYCSRACARVRTFITCARCGLSFHPDHLARRFCSKACKVAAQTTGRRTLRRTLPKARAAQRLVRYHVQAGNLVRPVACEQCGASGRKIEAAHYNYDQPLRVRWLCRSCHVRWDRLEPKGRPTR